MTSTKLGPSTGESFLFLMYIERKVPRRQHWRTSSTVAGSMTQSKDLASLRLCAFLVGQSFEATVADMTSISREEIKLNMLQGLTIAGCYVSLTISSLTCCLQPKCAGIVVYESLHINVPLPLVVNFPFYWNACHQLFGPKFNNVHWFRLGD